MKILPSPMFPVLAAAARTPATLSVRLSGTTTSTLIFGRKSTVYSPPRYSSVWPFWRPNPRTSDTVMPTTPMPVSASLTSSSLNGLMTASIFFIAGPPALRGATPVPTRAGEKASANRALDVRLGSISHGEDAYESGSRQAPARVLVWPDRYPRTLRNVVGSARGGEERA